MYLTRRTSATTWLCLLALAPVAALASESSPWYVRAPAATPVSSNGAPAAPATAIKSLDDIYKLALVRAETVAIQDEVLYQSHELDVQARAALYPAINGTATTLLQQPSSNTIGSTFSPENQNTAKVSLDQPLFRGFRDFAALKQRGAQVNQQKAALQDAARQLFYNTATAYYTVLAYQSDEKNYQNEIEINRKRLGDLQGFVRIGRSQITDVLTQKSQIAQLEFALETTRGQLEVSKETLAFFSGLDRDTPIGDGTVVPAQAAEVATYLAHIDERPDIKASLDAVQVSEQGVPIAFGQHFPSVDLLGDYYFVRPGAQQDVHWDVALALSLPIFQGGAIVSQTRQAASVVRQTNLQLSQARRQAEQEIRQFHDAFTADQRQIAKLEEASNLGKSNYEAEIRLYRNGLVTNLDVLKSISDWQDSLRTLEHQQFQAKMDFAKLQAASAQRKDIFIESELVR